MCFRVLARAALDAFIVALAVTATMLGWRLADPPSVSDSGQAPTVSERDPRPEHRWLVGIDGWRVAFDEVSRAAWSDPVIQTARPGELASPYDPLIRRHADAEGLDWRLISAVIHEESGFRHDAESAKGAYGLMQVREIAAREVGESEFRAPSENIRTGVRYLKRLEGMFARSEGWDRLALMLAAYHMGPSHVQDAQQLARRLGFDPDRWYGSLERVLPLLEQPAVHTSLPNGYARGVLTVQYVSRVLTRYAQHIRLAVERLPSG